jgi:HAD superfamily hydrolase (TIGR01450 family)
MDPVLKAFLLDLDGTLISKRQALPGARSLLARLGDRFAVVSNNAEDTPASLAAKLANLDLPVPAERIVLAGTTALERLAREQANSRILLLGSRELRHYGASLGLDITEHYPTVVLVARDRDFSYARLEIAANAVRRGARLIVANPDLVHPGNDGSVVPETGALLAAILACTGPVPYEIVGKPEPALFLRALALLDARPEDAVMVGDNPATDGAGALRLGMQFMAVEPSVAPLTV